MVATARKDGTEMGRPKKQRGPGEDPKAVTIKGSEAWRSWVNELADFRRLRTTDLIDQALVEYAERHGFTKRAPKR